MDTSNVNTTFTYINVTASDTHHSVPVYVLVVTILSCILSFVGIICIFVSYYAIPSVRNYIRKLLLFLTIANLLDVIGIVMGIIRYMLIEYADDKYHREVEPCVFQSVLTSFAQCSSFFWTVFIAVYIQVQVLKPSWADKMSGKIATVTYHVIAWGIPGVTCIVTLFFDVFGDTDDIFTGPWCWIRTEIQRDKAILWMFLTVKGWEMLAYIMLAEVLVFVIYKKYILPKCLKKKATFSDIFGQGSPVNVSKGLRREDRNFVYVWLIFYVLRFGGTFRFLMHIIKDPLDEEVIVNTDKTMMVWQAFGDTAQAFGNFLFLCVFDKVIRQHYCGTSSLDNAGNYNNMVDDREEEINNRSVVIRESVET